jgi:hypothetical protein
MSARELLGRLTTIGHTLIKSLLYLSAESLRGSGVQRSDFPTPDPRVCVQHAPVHRPCGDTVEILRVRDGLKRLAVRHHIDLEE